MPSFDNKKSLKFIITLNTKTFEKSDNTKNNRIILSGFRATVEVNKIGGAQNNTLRARICGVSQSDMNSITNLRWSPGYDIHNYVEVYAIDGKEESLVFAGHIVDAFGDYQGIPDVFLMIQASSNYDAQVSAVNALSVKGGMRVDAIMEQIAKKLKKQFKSVEVDAVLVDMYAAGDLISQARQIADAAGIDLVLDDQSLTILKRNTSIPGMEPEISKETGLIGYPTFDGTGVDFRCVFNPAIVFRGAVKLITSLPNANGRWIVDSVSAHLESEKPGGAWFSYVRGSSHGQAFKN